MPETTWKGVQAGTAFKPRLRSWETSLLICRTTGLSTTVQTRSEKGIALRLKAKTTATDAPVQIPAHAATLRRLDRSACALCAAKSLSTA